MSNEFKKLSSEFIAYGVSSLINRGIQILVLPLIFIYLSKEQFGTLDFFLTTKNLFFAILGWGILTSIMRFGAKFSTYSFSEVFSNSIIAMGFIVLLFGSVFYIFLPKINDIFFSGRDYKNEFIIVFFISSILAFQSIPLGALRTKRKPWHYFFVSFSFFTVFILVTWKLLTLNLGYWSFLYGNLIGAFVSTILGFSLTRKFLMFNVNLNLISAILKFGFSILFNSLTLTILASSSRYFLKLDNSVSALGILGMSTRLSLVVGALLVLPFNLAWLPFVNSIYNTEKFHINVQKVFEVFNIVALVLILGISIFSYDFFYLTKNFEYLEVYKYVPFFSFSYLFLGNYFIFASGIYIKKASKQYIIISIITVVSNLLLYAFATKTTILLASIITLASYIIFFILSFIFGNDILKIKIFSKTIKMLLISIMFFILLLGITFILVSESYYTFFILRILEYFSLVFLLLYFFYKTNSFDIKIFVDN